MLCLNKKTVLQSFQYQDYIYGCLYNDVYDYVYEEKKSDYKTNYENTTMVNMVFLQSY